MEKEHREQVAWRDTRIGELEKAIQGYKKDLEEKIVENADIKRGLEQLRKREVNEKKKKSVG
jgi:regulator of replication initiation timing